MLAEVSVLKLSTMGETRKSGIINAWQYADNHLKVIEEYPMITQVFKCFSPRQSPHILTSGSCARLASLSVLMTFKSVVENGKLPSNLLRIRPSQNLSTSIPLIPTRPCLLNPPQFIFVQLEVRKEEFLEVSQRRRDLQNSFDLRRAPVPQISGSQTAESLD